MLDRRRKAPRPAPPLVSRLPDAETAERPNGDFSRELGQPATVRREWIRVTSHSRFLARWSAP